MPLLLNAVINGYASKIDAVVNPGHGMVFWMGKGHRGNLQHFNKNAKTKIKWNKSYAEQKPKNTQKGDAILVSH